MLYENNEAAFSPVYFSLSVDKLKQTLTNATTLLANDMHHLE